MKGEHAIIPLRAAIILVTVGALVVQPGCGGGGAAGGGGQLRADVQGRVVDDGTLQPVAGASVSVGGQSVGTTNALGEFSGQDVPAGDVTFQISLGGYDTLAEQRTLTANQNNDLRSLPFYLALTLSPGQGVVTGYVEDASASAVGSATVTVTPRSNPSAVCQGTSRTDGTFKVYQVLAGTADLAAQGTVSQPGQAWLNGIPVPDQSSYNVGTLTLSSGPPPPPFP